MVSAVADTQVQVKMEETQGFVEDGVPKGKCKTYMLISFAALLALAAQSALTVGLLAAMIGPMPHMGKDGVLEASTGNPVATAELTKVLSASELGKMSPEELKTTRTVQIPGTNGTWSSYHIASVHKLGRETIELVAIDGTRFKVENGTTAEAKPADFRSLLSRRSPGRRLPHYKTWVGTLGMTGTVGVSQSRGGGR